jgi:hypothetical protein
MVMALLTTGCSMYVEHPVDAPLPPGTDIRAQLTTSGAVRFSGLIGQPTEYVEGSIIGLERDSLHLALLRATEYGRPWDSVDTLSFATSEIMRLEEKRIDKGRTAILAGGVGAVSGVVIGALFRAATRSRDNDGGEEDLILIPFFTIYR